MIGTAIIHGHLSLSSITGSAEIEVTMKAGFQMQSMGAESFDDSEPLAGVDAAGVSCFSITSGLFMVFFPRHSARRYPARPSMTAGKVD